MINKNELVLKNTGVKESAGFDINKVLNSSEFLKFLATYPDAENFDMENEDEIQERFETFEKKEALKKELRTLYSSHIEKEMGIKLQGNDLSSIDAYLEKQAIENPEEIAEMQNKINSFKGLPQQIKGLEGELSALGNQEALQNKLSELELSKNALERAKNKLGVTGSVAIRLRSMKKSLKWLNAMTTNAKSEDALNKMKEHGKEYYNEAEELRKDKEALATVSKKHGKINKKQAGVILENIEKEIEAHKVALAKLEKLSSYKKDSERMFTETRKELFGGISEIKGLSKAIQDKVSKELKDLVGKGSLKDLESAYKKFEKFQEISESTETGVSMLGDATQEEKLEAEIGKAVGYAVAKNTEDAVLKLKISNNPLASLEKALEPLMKKESWGSERAEKMKETIIEILDGISEKLKKSNESDDKIKKLLISRMVFILSS